MKTSIAILLALTVLVSAGQAQQEQKIKGFAISGKFGYLGAPGSASAFSAVSSLGMGGFTDHYFGCGIDGYYRTSNIIVGLKGITGMQSSSSSALGTYHAKPWVGATHAMVGYVINKKNDTHWIYPSFGMGSSFALLGSSSKNADGTTHYAMDRMLFSPSVDFAINADFLVNNVGDRTKYGAFVMGLRAGYYASFTNSNWRNSNGDVVSNSPSYANNAFYITLSIGGGWFYRRNVVQE